MSFTGSGGANALDQESAEESAIAALCGDIEVQVDQAEIEPADLMAAQNLCFSQSGKIVNGEPIYCAPGSVFDNFDPGACNDAGAAGGSSEYNFDDFVSGDIREGGSLREWYNSCRMTRNGAGGPLHTRDQCLDGGIDGGDIPDDDQGALPGYANGSATIEVSFWLQCWRYFHRTDQ